MTLSKQECESIDNVIFIAGGVGVNPIISMFAAMDWKGVSGVGGMRPRVRVLYASKRERSETILFEDRITGIARRWESVDGVDCTVRFFETGDGAQAESDDEIISRKRARIQHDDLIEALGPENSRKNTVVYVCGVPSMTDEFVEFLKTTPGLDEKRVLCEEWW